ncbi:class F sortase [Nocardioides sp.]|uniref:class F sortase n=1 Tax=Nocardioides sp. TaxID=35761 RepID=UPI0039E72650
MGLLIGVIGIGLIGAAIWVATRTPEGLADLNGNLVQLDPGTVPDAETLKKMDVVEDNGLRFKAPSVGLDVPLGEMSMVDSIITPPGLTSVYWVRNIGVGLDAAADGTVYVATHSLRDGATGPGNYLIDIDARRAAITRGALITVGDLRYRVTGSREITKTELPRARQVWVNRPRRLVVVTCLQRPEGEPSLQNVVIFARLVG